MSIKTVNINLAQYVVILNEHNWPNVSFSIIQFELIAGI
jgi:hypothetical protein